MHKEMVGAECSADADPRVPWAPRVLPSFAGMLLSENDLAAMQFDGEGCYVVHRRLMIAMIDPSSPKYHALVALFAASPALLQFYRAFKRCAVALASGDEKAFKAADKELDAIDLQVLTRLGPLA